jgi:hypothetical protein
MSAVPTDLAPDVQDSARVGRDRDDGRHANSMAPKVRWPHAEGLRRQETWGKPPTDIAISFQEVQLRQRGKLGKPHRFASRSHDRFAISITRFEMTCNRSATSVAYEFNTPQNETCQISVTAPQAIVIESAEFRQPTVPLGTACADYLEGRHTLLRILAAALRGGLL